MKKPNKGFEVRQRIAECLRGAGKEGMTKWQIRDGANIRKIECFKQLFFMVQHFAVIRLGTGKRRDPFKYALAEFHLGSENAAAIASPALKPKGRFLMTVA